MKLTDELKKNLEELKLLFEGPRLFVENFFKDLKNQVNSNAPEEQKTELIDKIELFEIDCFKNIKPYDKVDIITIIMNYEHDYNFSIETKKNIQKIEEKIKVTKGELTEIDFNSNDSICRQVSNREPQLQRFAQENDVILFVSGKKSSNGKALYQVCLSENPRSYFIENEEEIELDWFQNAERVGICGATSTPMWLMEQVKEYVSGISERILQA